MPADFKRSKVLAIGGSAGSIQLLNRLLPALPPALPMAVVVVIHLPAGVPSELPSIYGPQCRMPVREVSDKDLIETGTIVFAPPGYHLLVEDERTFALSIDAPVHFSRPSIDVLFESVADVYGDRAIGVVLSGASHDGAAGLKRIADRGGVAVVQSTATAAVPRMPEAARQALAPEIPMTIEEMLTYLQALRETL